MRWYPRFSVDFSTSRHDLCQSSRSATYSIVYQNHLHDITPVNMLGAVWRSVFALMSAATAPLVVGALLHISIRSTHMLDRHSRALVRQLQSLLVCLFNRRSHLWCRAAAGSARAAAARARAERVSLRREGPTMPPRTREPLATTRLTRRGRGWLGPGVAKGVASSK